jgi:hypothetical protein
MNSILVHDRRHISMEREQSASLVWCQMTPLLLLLLLLHL